MSIYTPKPPKKKPLWSQVFHHNRYWAAVERRNYEQAALAEQKWNLTRLQRLEIDQITVEAASNRKH